MRRLVHRVVGGLALLSTVSSCLIMIAVVLDVGTRTITGGSLPGMVDATETFMVVLVFFGIAQAEKADGHIKMTLVTERLPARVVHGLRVVAYISYTGITGWLLWAVTRRAVSSSLAGEYRDGLVRWPLWPARLAIAIGVAVLLLIVVTKLADLLRGRDSMSPSASGEVDPS